MATRYGKFGASYGGKSILDGYNGDSKLQERLAQAQFDAQQQQQADQAKKDNNNDLLHQVFGFGKGILTGVKTGTEQAIGSIAGAADSLLHGDGKNAVTDWADKQVQKDQQDNTNANAGEKVGNFLGSFGGGVVKGVVDPASTFVRGVEALPEGIVADLAGFSSNKNVVKAAVDKQNELKQRVFGTTNDKEAAIKLGIDTAQNIINVVTAGKGGVVTDAAGSLFTKIAGKEASEQLVKTAAERIASGETTDAVAKAIAQKASSHVSSSAIKNYLRTGTRAGVDNAVLSAPIDALQQYDATGRVDPVQLAKDATTNFGGGVLLGGRTLKKERAALNQANKTTNTAGDVVNNATQDATQTAANATDKKQLLLGDGLPSSKDIAAQIQDLQNGNYPQDLMKTTDTTTKINDPNYAKDQAALSKSYDAELKAIEKDPNLDATAKADAANKVNNKYEQLNNQLDQKYSQADNAGVNTGVGSQTSVDKAALKQRFTELNQQYNDALAREANVAASAANERLAATPKVADVQTEINNYNSGNKPDQLYTSDQRPQDLLDVANNQKLPQQLRDSAEKTLQTVQDGRLANDNFMTTENYQYAKQAVLDDYNAQVSEINKMPDGAYKDSKLQEASNTFEQDMADIESQYNDSAIARQHDANISQFEGQRTQQIVNDANAIMDANPNDFRTLNPEADAAYQQELTNKMYEAKTAEFMNPNKVQDGVSSSDELSHLVDTSSSKEQFVHELNNNPIAEKASEVLNTDVAEELSVKKQGVATTALGRLAGIPRSVMRSWGDVGKQWADKLDNAMIEYSMHHGTLLVRLNDWSKLLDKNEKSFRNVFDALDNGDVSKLSNNELLVYKDAREYFSEMADKLGIDPEGRITNYIPHLIKNATGKDAAALDRTIQVLKYGVDESGKKISQSVRTKLNMQLKGLDSATMRYLDLNTSYKMKNGFLEHRTGAPEYERDLLSVINLYDTIGAKKVYLEPAMEEISSQIHNNKGVFSKYQEKYMSELFESISGKSQSEIQSSLDDMIKKIIPVDDASGKLLRGFRRLTNAALMGGSVSTALKNTQAFVNIMAKIPPQEWSKAVIPAAKSLKAGSHEWRELYQSGVMDASFSSFIRDISHGGRSKTTQLIDKAEVPMWTMMRNVDQLGRATAYFAKRDSYLKSIGKTLEDASSDELHQAMVQGRIAARKTSFEFTPLDTPLAMRTDMGKLALQMNSWNLQEADFIKNLFHGYEDSLFTDGKINAKGAYSLLAFAAGTAGFYYTVGEVTGMKPADLVPFGSDVTQGQMPQSPIMSLLGIGGSDSNPGLIQIGQASDSQRGAVASKVGSKFLTNLIPGSAQFQRTVNGIDSITSGVSKNKNGQVQFIQNTDPASQLRAAVFGKYTTQNGHEWVTNGFPTLSDSQSGVVDKLGTQESKQKVTDFFVALNNAPGRQDAVTNVKDAVKAGDINKATRLANEYNQKVRDALKKYYADHGDLPGTVGYDRNGNELTGSSYLNDKLINVSKYEDN